MNSIIQKKIDYIKIKKSNNGFNKDLNDRFLKRINEIQKKK